MEFTTGKRVREILDSSKDEVEPQVISRLDTAADILELQTVDTDFREAVEYVMTNPKAASDLTEDNQSVLYGLFQVATQGPAAENYPGSPKYDDVKQYEAHKKAGNITKHQAKLKYCEVLIGAIPDYIFADVAEDTSKPASELPDDIKEAVKDQLGVDDKALEDPNAPAIPPDRIPFLEAIVTGNVARAKSLTNDNPKLVNKRDDQGVTPLMLACDREQQEIVEWLLECPEIKINETDDDNQTALHYAIIVENAQAVESLLESGAQVNIQDTDGFTPLESARSAGSEDLVTLLEAAAI